MVDEACCKVIEESIARGSLENDDEEDTRNEQPPPT